MIERFKEKVSKFYSDKNLFFLLSIWLLTFIFGSYIGSYSVGSFTIYPNLLIGLLFIPLFFKGIFISPKSIKIFILFLSLFLIYSFSWILIHGSNYLAFFELRSHLFYLNTFLIILSCYYGFSSKECFTKALKNGLWFLFAFLVIIGFVESFFHIHLLNDFYSYGEPMFIFGNPNDYFLYCLVLFLILLFVDRDCFSNFWLIISCLFALLILAYISKARLGEFIIIILFFIALFREVKIIKLFSKNKYYFLFLSLTFLIIVANKLVKDDERKNFDFYSFLKTEPKIVIPTIKVSPKVIVDTIASEPLTVSEDVPVQNDTIISQLEVISDSIKKEVAIIQETPDSIKAAAVITQKTLKFEDVSLNVRAELILNGLDLIKKNPIFGVGPGQFQEQNRLKNVPYDIGTNYSPHNYFIELISNYAILGFSFFLYIFYLFIKLFKLKTETSFWLKVSLIIFFIASVLPSAFIYQPINWLFMSIWILYSQIEINIKSVRQ